MKPQVEFLWFEGRKLVKSVKKELRTSLKGLQYAGRRPQQVNLLNWRLDTLAHGSTRHWLYTEVVGALEE